jgi:hypothetical protein
LALARQGSTGPAVSQLETAAERFPHARRHLHAYLDSPGAQRRAEVERWMKSLRE